MCFEGIRSGSSFDRVSANVEGLVDVMRELSAERPRLLLVFVAMRIDGHREAFAAAAELADQLGVELRLPRLEQPGVERFPGTPGCSWPFESAYVTHDAKVQPCCMVMGADRAVLGDAERQGFDVVWRGPEYRRFRAALLTDEPPAVCAGCSLYRRLF